MYIDKASMTLFGVGQNATDEQELILYEDYMDFYNQQPNPTIQTPDGQTHAAPLIADKNKSKTGLAAAAAVLGYLLLS